MNFVNAMQNELNSAKKLTTNGAIGWETSGKKLLDLNFSVVSLRKAPEQEIIDKFVGAYYDDQLTAIKWLFYVRDAREGTGERRLFRVVMKWLAQNNPEIAKAVMEYIPFYGRWDDMWCLLDTKLKQNVINMIGRQLSADDTNIKNKHSISLMYKWMPSVNASSAETKRLGNIIRIGLGMTPRNYRKMLSNRREYLDVVERKMSAKQWNEIDYEAVPSRANLIYNGAFLRNDEARRREYLAKLEKGEAKINASVLFPDDIVHKYNANHFWNTQVKPYDATLEGLWNALPNIATENTLVVRDGSGSMMGKPMDVSTAIAIYMAERTTGDFHNKFITFSSRPKLVDLDGLTTLHDKLIRTYQETDCSNTDIYKVFKLILDTAVNNNMKQEDMPKNIVIISDMQFDGCAHHFTDTLFDTIAKAYARYGYQLPKLVFWNVNEYSQNNVVPVQQNELGVVLMSGYSQNLVKMVMSNQVDPYKCLLEQINSQRYQVIEEAVKELI